MKQLSVIFLLFASILLSAAPAENYGSSIDVEPPRSAMIIRGNILCMTFCADRRIVAAFDISTPAEPKLISIYRTGYFPQSIISLKSTGNTLKLMVADGRFLSILKLTDKRKLVLQERHLVSMDPAAGPVDMIGFQDKLILARRNGGIMIGQKQFSTAFSRALFSNGEIWYSVSQNAITGSDGSVRQIPVGTPRAVRQFLNSDQRLFVADGWSGLSVISKNDVFLTTDFSRIFKNDGYVFDVVPAAFGNGKVHSVFLAAGGAGVVSADVSDPNGKIVLTGFCRDFRHCNVNGLLHGPGSILYVSDENFGLRVLDVSDIKQMKIIGGIPLISSMKK